MSSDPLTRRHRARAEQLCPIACQKADEHPDPEDFDRVSGLAYCPICGHDDFLHVSCLGRVLKL